MSLPIKQLEKERDMLAVAVIWLAQQARVIAPGTYEVNIPADLDETAKDYKATITDMIDGDTHDKVCFTIRIEEK